MAELRNSTQRYAAEVARLGDRLLEMQHTVARLSQEASTAKSQNIILASTHLRSPFFPWSRCSLLTLSLSI